MKEVPVVNGHPDGSSSWVVELEEKLVETDRDVEMGRFSRSSIYRVPEWLKDMTHDTKAYQPRLVSLGPFHHGREDLLAMEEHKRRAALHIVKRSGKPLKAFAAAIEGVVDELLDAYHQLDERWRNEDRHLFVEMMVLDGCFLLELLKGLASRVAPPDYAPNDPVFSTHGMLTMWVGIRCDMVIIENQIPLLALYKLEQVWRGTTPVREKDINTLVLDFVWDPLTEYKPRKRVVVDKLCLHPLDVYHRNFCGLYPGEQGTEIQFESSMRCAVELKEAGVHLKMCDNTNVIDYKSNVLSLPPVSIDHDGTEKIFFNLMAFERLHSNTRNEATDYMIFMDNIIDSERDVALLRSKGIIINLLSSDKEAAQLFNNLTRGAVLSPFSRLHEVRRKVNAHCTRPWNRWRATFQHTYLSNPWVLISLIAATILLIATLLQTVYTVLSSYKPT